MVASTTSDSRAPPPAGRRAPAAAVPHGQAGAVLDDLERHADHRLVLAQQQAARHETQRVGQPAQDAVLARHVVRAGRQFAGGGRRSTAGLPSTWIR